MKTCEGCMFWSEMIAQATGCGPVKALCMNDCSNNFNKMVTTGCEEYEEGTPIDSPEYLMG